jgi:hypothetical protein
MSSSGEMKMSLKLMICQSSGMPPQGLRCYMPTFSCLRCFSSFSSLYVRFERTGVLKGFMIFLMATAWLVSWSLAELPDCQHVVRHIQRRCRTRQGRTRPCPRAADRCIFIKVSSARSTQRSYAAPACYLERRPEDLRANEFCHLDDLRG